MASLDVIEATYDVDSTFFDSYEQSWKYWYQSAFSSWTGTSQASPSALWVRYYLYHLGPAIITALLLAVWIRLEFGVWFPEALGPTSSWASFLAIVVLLNFFAVSLVGAVLESSPAASDNLYSQAAFSREIGRQWELRLCKEGIRLRSDRSSQWLSWNTDFCFATVWESYLLIIHQDGIASVPINKLNCHADRAIELVGKWHRDAKDKIKNE